MRGFVELVESSYACAYQQGEGAMITGGWTPPKEVVEFEQADEEPADDQFDKLSVAIEDPGALVHLLDELGD